MTTVQTRLILSVLAVGALTGCQNIFAGNHRVSSAAVEEVDLSDYFARRLAEGRMHLQANRPGAAAVAFRHAAYDPALRASAFNGMAISYDRLGRTDLAQRYFMAAIELEPENPSFASNFIRFSEARADHSAAAEALALAEAEALLAGAADFADMAGDQSGETQASEGIMQRISEREVHIASQEEAPASSARDRNQRMAIIHVGRSTGEDTSGRLAYPVRFALSDVGDSSSESRASGRQGAEQEQTRAAARARVPAARLHKGYPIRVPIRETS